MIFTYSDKNISRKEKDRIVTALFPWHRKEDTPQHESEDALATIDDKITEAEFVKAYLSHEKISSQTGGYMYSRIVV